MRHAARTFRRRSVSATCFVSDAYTESVDEQALLIKFYPAWQPSEVKRLTPRMRQYWIDMAIWRTQKGP